NLIPHTSAIQRSTLHQSLSLACIFSFSFVSVVILSHPAGKHVSFKTDHVSESRYATHFRHEGCSFLKTASPNHNQPDHESTILVCDLMHVVWNRRQSDGSRILGHRTGESATTPHTL